MATERNGPAGHPYLLYPEAKFVWDKPLPKSSLVGDNRKHAAGWILNVIEALHWSSFPIGFYVAFYVFMNTATIASKLVLDGGTGATARVFFIILGLLSQVFGGGIPVMMHIYEGWLQVTPFRNIIALPDNPTPTQLNEYRIFDFYNAWLRSVAYRMLFTFQAFGLGAFSMAVYGFTPLMVGLVSISTIVSLLGPQRPRLKLSRNVDGEERPFLPLSVSLAIAAGVNLNIVVNIIAAISLFSPSIEAAWAPTVLPWLSVIPARIGAKIAAALPALLMGGGGAYKGAIAETSFNQWDHLIAFVLLLSGLGLYGATFWHLVNT